MNAVVSLNDLRRHLDESQRALAAAKVANLSEGGRKGNKNASKNDAVNLPRRFPETPPAPAPTKEDVSVAEAAAAFNVSERSVRYAKKVLEEGIR